MTNFKRARIDVQPHRQMPQVAIEDLDAMMLEHSDHAKESSMADQAMSLVELVLRNCESSDAVTQIVANAFAEEEVETAEAAAREDFAVIAEAWPAQRQENMKAELNKKIDVYARHASALHTKQVSATQAQRLQTQMLKKAAQCLEAARDGHLDVLEGDLRQLMQLRDLAYHSGYLQVQDSELLSAAFALDIATEQIKGELDRIAETDPLLAVEYAYDFTPDVKGATANVLKRRAEQIAETALMRQLAAKNAEKDQRRMSQRVQGLSFLLQRLMTYLSGQAPKPSESYRHDPRLRAFNDNLLLAASGKSVGDVPYLAAYVKERTQNGPLLWGVQMILRLAASGDLSWPTTVHLCQSNLMQLGQADAPRA